MLIPESVNSPFALNEGTGFSSHKKTCMSREANADYGLEHDAKRGGATKDGSEKRQLTPMDVERLVGARPTGFEDPAVDDPRCVVL